MVKEFINDGFIFFAFIGNVKRAIGVETDAFGLGMYFLFEFLRVFFLKYVSFTLFFYVKFLQFSKKFRFFIVFFVFDF